MARTRRRKKRSHQEQGADPSKKAEPRTFVFRRGKNWGLLGDLESDLRRMMLPFTASSLRESKRNTLKDFLAVSGPLGVSHFLILTATDRSSYLRVAKTPRGPTVTLRIRSYSLMSDVASSQARPRVPPNAFKTPPLVVLNNFDPKVKQLALAGSLFQGMFPSINVHTVNLATCQRVVLLSVDPSTRLISLRHFTISTAPSGVKKSLKGLVTRSAVPDLGGLQDVSELITRSGYGSESEGEDAEASRVVLPSAAPGRAGRALVGKQSRVRLHEVGPRLELEIVKVEEGLCDGAVLFHAHVAKSKAEVSAQQAARDEAAREKAVRRQQQEENVRRKQAEKRRLAELQREAQQAKQGPEAVVAKRRQWWAAQQAEAAAADGDRQQQQQEAEDDDIAYYRQEVGQEPDAEERIGLGKRGGRGGRSGRGGRGGGGRGKRQRQDSAGDEFGGGEAHGGQAAAAAADAADGGGRPHKRLAAAAEGGGGRGKRGKPAAHTGSGGKRGKPRRKHGA